MEQSLVGVDAMPTTSYHSLAVHERPDIETKRWTDTRDVLAVELLKNRRFTRIVQPTGRTSTHSMG